MRTVFLLLLSLVIFSFTAKAAVIKPLKNTADSLEQYTGKFKFASGPVTEVEVVLENGTLKILSSQGNSTLAKTDEADVFTLVEYDGKATYKRNSDKKITGIKIEVMGIVLEGEKEGS